MMNVVTAKFLRLSGLLQATIRHGTTAAYEQAANAARQGSKAAQQGADAAKKAGQEMKHETISNADDVSHRHNITNTLYSTNNSKIMC